MTHSIACAQRIASLGEIERALDSGYAESWLADGERETAAGIRSAHRRLQWLGGRWLAKSLLVDVVGAELRATRSIAPGCFYIESSNASGKGTRPRIHYRGRLQRWSLSISHFGDSVYVALAMGKGITVGVDIVDARQPGRGFLETWFTPRERMWLAREPERAASAWAVKEAAYKALNRGDAFVPRQFEVDADAAGGYSCRWRGVELASSTEVHVRQAGDVITALVVARQNEESYP